MIGLARLVGDRCAVELGFDAATTMFRASFAAAGRPSALVVRWAEGVALVEAGEGGVEEVTDLARLAALCDAALASV